jgi:membrane associated rhomboid family serine protease
VGIYDRDYYREPQRSGFSSRLPSTVIGTLILINVVVWLADLLTSTTYPTPHGPKVFHWLSEMFAVHVGESFQGRAWWIPLTADTLKHPWLWWQFLTAGFTHDPNNIWHILGNMFVLFVFGRDIEARYGSREFLRFYLAALLVASIGWCLVTELAVGANGAASMIGASGAIAGVVVLFAFNFPRATLLLFFVFPVPAWLVGVGIVLYDIFGAMGGVRGSNVAYVAHVAGAAFALVYYLQGWNLTRWSGGLFAWPAVLLGRARSLFRRKPRLRVHQPDEPPPHPDFNAEVDRILEKIYREGEGSLTPKERQTLERASREYQRKGAGNNDGGKPPNHGS